MNTLFCRTSNAFAFAACLVLAPASLCQAASALSVASATVLPMAQPEQPILVEVARSSSLPNSVIVSVVSASARNDGASLSAALVSSEAAPIATLQAGQAVPARSEVLASVRTGDTAALTAPGLLSGAQRLSTTISQNELGAQGQVALTLNYN